ncbi:MAG TPA: TolC family protein [Gemmatimonadales bacterium]|nr:TolC family protein [Gemmatimonadales bacterium]
MGLAGLAGPVLAGRLAAQQPVTRAQAVAAALLRGARAAFGRADTAGAAAALHAARLYPNPSFATSYTQDVPHYHVLATVPLDLPWLRAARVGAAASARDAARLSFAFERAAIRFEVDTTYTRALAALAHARLSRRTASDADSLLVMARLRREVGDVSDLDVRLAEVNAGSLENIATDDSLAALDGLLALQLAMGLPADTPTIRLVDSLAPPPDTLPVGAAVPLPVAAATASLASEARAVTLARRNLFPAPGLQVGFDAGDPSQPPGLLPTIGLSLALPLFNWNGGEVAQAAAARDRARANLDLVERQTAAERARVERGRAAALARLARDRRLLASADRVAAMALQAYAEGAVALQNVLEAQRNAREALGRYIDDVAASVDAAAAVRLVSAADEP